MTTAVVSFDGPMTPEINQVIQQFMDANAGYHDREVADLVSTLGVSRNCALDISYLRTRSRHTPELEQRLIQEHKDGKAVNICDWPWHSDEGRPAFG